MKKVILVILIIGSLFGLFYLASIAPYHIYTLTLTEGVDTSFLKMSPTKKSFYDGESITYFEDDELIKSSKSIYTSIHLSNFLVTLPINHFSISMIPTIKVESNQVKVGADIIDPKYRNQFTFMMEREILFDTNIENQKLYLLPIFRNYIAKKSHIEVWSDLFSKKLSLPSNEGKSFKESLDALNKVSYQELVYNLYILNLRTKLLPEDILNLKFDPELNIGLVTISEDETDLVERIYYLHQGIIYPITITTSKLSKLGMYSRNKFIRELKYKLSTKDAAIPIYAEYKNLKYSDRIEQKGMVYLFSAWSHDVDNKDYIRVIILFLERGRSNVKFLRPFYEYAYKKFGSSFSGNHDFLVETPEEKLKRQMAEELEKETQQENSKNTAKFEGNYTDPDEKVKALLQKAKDKKFNSDEKKMELNMDGL